MFLRPNFSHSKPSAWEAFGRSLVAHWSYKGKRLSGFDSGWRLIRVIHHVDETVADEGENAKCRYQLPKSLWQLISHTMFGDDQLIDCTVTLPVLIKCTILGPFPSTRCDLRRLSMATTSSIYISRPPTAHRGRIEPAFHRCRAYEGKRIKINLGLSVTVDDGTGRVPEDFAALSIFCPCRSENGQRFPYVNGWDPNSE